jgi:hypothetical protein
MKLLIAGINGFRRKKAVTNENLDRARPDTLLAGSAPSA